MKENTNSAIIYNSVVLYVRLFITATCSIISTRYALQALGINDYGLFAVIGSVISFIALLNSIMVSVSQRFISVAIGRNNPVEIREQFSINLLIHIGIAIVTLLVAIPVGYWYVYYKLNYDGSLDIAFIVFIISCIASVISFIGVPYNGLLVAKERFLVFCIPDVISAVIKLLVSYLLVYHFSNKLVVYASMMAIVNSYPTLVYSIYCKGRYRDVTKFILVKNLKKYKEVFSYSVWIAYGAFASMAKSQGAAILINRFFSTAMNTGLGLATSITQYISMFAENVSKPMAPQIMKFYASDNIERSYRLLVFSTKISYLIIFIISAPFFIGADWLIQLWLGEVPPYVTSFLYLLIIDTLIQSFNTGVANLIFANGRIRMYQICSNTLRILSVIVAYFALKAGLPAVSLLFSYIIFSSIIIVVNQIVLHKTTGFNNWVLIKGSYIPCIIVTTIVIPVYFVHIPVHPFLHILLTLVYVFIIEFLFGFNKDEKKKLLSIIKR